MRLLYFVQYFYPEKAAGLYLVDDLLRGLVSDGWTVDVYTSMPTRGVDDQIRAYYQKNPTESLYDGKLVVHRMPLYREGKGFIRRTIRYLIFSLQCYRKALKEPAQVIFTGSGPPTQGVVLGMVRRKRDVRFVYNLQDMFPDSLINAGICKENSVLTWIGRKMERFTYKEADSIITISEDMRKNLLSKGVNPKKIQLVRNWIDIGEIKPIRKEENILYDRLKIDRRKFHVVYSGNIGYTMGLEYLIDAAELIKNNHKIEFLIFGDGSDHDKIVKLAKDKKLNNVRFFPFQSKNLISSVYGLGDVAYISSRPNLSAVSMPSKTFTIMASGRAILGSFDTHSEFARIIREANCGECIEPGNSVAIAESVLHMANSYNQCAMWGENSRLYVKKSASRENGVRKYIDIINSQFKDK